MAKIRPAVQRVASGSPGAVLALAIGTAFLSLGWTGRYRAVWEAFRTGKSENDGSSGAANNQQMTQQFTQPVKVYKTNSEGVTVESTLFVAERANIVPAGNRACQGQTVKLASPQYGMDTGTIDSPTLYCIDPDNLFPWADLDTQGPNANNLGSNLGNNIGNSQAGQVIEPGSDLSTTVLPNGAFAFTKQPNVKGMFDVG